MILQYFRILQYHWSISHLAIICCMCHKLLHYVTVVFHMIRGLQSAFLTIILIGFLISNKVPDFHILKVWNSIYCHMKYFCVFMTWWLLELVVGWRSLIVVTFDKMISCGHLTSSLKLTLLVPFEEYTTLTFRRNIDHDPFVHHAPNPLGRRGRLFAKQKLHVNFRPRATVLPRRLPSCHGWHSFCRDWDRDRDRLGSEDDAHRPEGCRKYFWKACGKVYHARFFWRYVLLFRLFGLRVPQPRRRIYHGWSKCCQTQVDPLLWGEILWIEWQRTHVQMECRNLHRRTRWEF